MSIHIEDLRKIAAYPVSEHKVVVDAYIALGYDLDRIAISKGIYQEDAKRILLAYGFVKSDLGRFKKLPQELENEYIDHFYPGIDCAVPQNADINLEMYLDVYHPEWRSLPEKRSRSMMVFGLTADEQKIVNAGYKKETQDD